ncbi:TetR family transcriptional regulator [Streptomyces sp. NPDC059176]|uniref:TetR family transcriptional regulator n=1 Tax=unclassified Streptomyces TaxID=2593676 RepID=UPI003692336C
MARLTRAETQERTRARVLGAAREEFTEKGFRAAKIDAIAERAELTRGAVYSNFPGKRALYFAVLADLAERAPLRPAPAPEMGRTVSEALGALARAWVARLPVDASTGQGGLDRIGEDLMPEILADEGLRRVCVQLIKVDALLIALSVERIRPPGAPVRGAPPRRAVRLAETVLTTLHGASRMAAVAPGFVEPFDIVSACERLAGLELDDWWAPPSAVVRVGDCDGPWSPPTVTDLVRGGIVRPVEDGVVAVLGLHRLSAIEEAVRAVPPGLAVTAVMVMDEPDELAPLARLLVAELAGFVREAFPRSAWPRLRVVCDSTGAFAAAAGATSLGDDTELAVRISEGRVVARAEGSGACHAAASAALSPRLAVHHQM